QHHGYFRSRAHLGTRGSESHRLFRPQNSLLRSCGVADDRAVWRIVRLVAGRGRYARIGDSISEFTAESGAAWIGSSHRPGGCSRGGNCRRLAAGHRCYAHARRVRASEGLTMTIPLMYNIRSVKARWTSTIVALLGIAATVG